MPACEATDQQNETITSAAAAVWLLTEVAAAATVMLCCLPVGRSVGRSTTLAPPEGEYCLHHSRLRIEWSASRPVVVCLLQRLGWRRETDDEASTHPFLVAPDQRTQLMEMDIGGRSNADAGRPRNTHQQHRLSGQPVSWWTLGAL